VELPRPTREFESLDRQTLDRPTLGDPAATGILVGRNRERCLFSGLIDSLRVNGAKSSHSQVRWVATAEVEQSDMKSPRTRCKYHRTNR
jgi:hypothetical protein